VNSPARLTLEAGEYAVFTVTDIADLRDTWIWALRDWLPGSGRRERNAPEFERYVAPYNPGRASGPIEVCIPLEPLSIS
jgi:AraC family transcriptional regulator